MSNIDLTQIITADDKSAAALLDRSGAAKAECRRRIFAVVDGTAQINLAAAAAAGILSSANLTVYQSGLGWIGSMRATWVTLAGDPSADLSDDASWPDVPAGVVDLANAF